MSEIAGGGFIIHASVFRSVYAQKSDDVMFEKNPRKTENVLLLGAYKLKAYCAFNESGLMILLINDELTSG